MPITSQPPPPRNTPNVGSSVPRVSTPKLTKEREEMVAQLGMFAQVPLIATKQLADAGAVGLYWPKIAKEVATLAESQEVIANLIDPLIRVGPYAGLIAAGLPLLMQIAVNHGRVKPGAMGTVPAVALQAQVEAAMANEELAATRAQLEAERSAAAMRQEIADQRAKVQQLANGSLDKEFSVPEG